MTALLLAGATGLVGQAVLRLALADSRVERLVAPTRRPLPAAPKLDNPVVDFAALPRDAPWWRVDAGICTLGTTMRKAGSRAAFQRVDRDLVIEIAALLHRHGAPAFAVNSAMGADARSGIFYNRTKGEMEDGLAALGFASLTVVRPGLIGGERAESRPAEAAGLKVLGALGPLLPRAWRVNPAERIAAALLDAALARRPGRQVVGSAELA